jgi:hypothetical protein
MYYIQNTNSSTFQNSKDEYIQNNNSSVCFMWVQNIVSAERTEITSSENEKVKIEWMNHELKGTLKEVNIVCSPVLSQHILEKMRKPTNIFSRDVLSPCRNSNYCTFFPLE